ncbi:type II secretion system F family protein [Agromyces ramosus]|uniref:Flp pilus assembly protein TadB n=1 Tax=Agromyces ramosus TaxID=33879 RepID=A0ABU0R946_9MICO|nr:type II secretion system F family protein [Agromyces ramosus]MDQ0894606.1 Flp pilus assembly protein TadB [Agromyces ramosus]
MNPVTLVGGIAIALLALLVFIFLVVAPPAPRVARDRRLAPGVEHISTLSRVTGKTTAAIESATAKRTRRLFGPRELELAGIKTEPSGFVILVASAACVLALIGAVIGFANGTSFVWAILLALLAPVGAKFVVSGRTSRRRARFRDQIDDTVQMMAGSLRAGHGLSRTVGAVASEAESPTSEELARVVNEVRLGRSLAESLSVTAQRMQSEDFEWVAQAVAINQETGGNLAEVLDQVGKTIRDRNEIRRQVKALSAEGRLSAIVLIALPIVVFLFLIIVQPTYFNAFFSTVVGVVALILAGVLLIVGSIWTLLTVRVKF